MPAIPIANLPAIVTVGLDDLVIIEQTIGTTTTTHKGTVRQLLGAAAPVPTITTLTWTGGGADRLEIEGDNLLPTTLVLVDDIPYKLDLFTYGSGANPNNSATLEIGLFGLATGTHTVKVKNLIHEATDTFTV